MVTGVYDHVSVNKSAELSRQCRELGKPAVKVYSCHIVSDSTMRDIDKHGPGGRAVKNKVRYFLRSSVACNYPHTQHSEAMLSLLLPYSGTLGSDLLPTESPKKTVSMILETCSRCKAIATATLMS